LAVNLTTIIMKHLTFSNFITTVIDKA